MAVPQTASQPIIQPPIAVEPEVTVEPQVEVTGETTGDTGDAAYTEAVRQQAALDGSGGLKGGS
jgi:hypothetical protein